MTFSQRLGLAQFASVNPFIATQLGAGTGRHYLQPTGQAACARRRGPHGFGEPSMCRLQSTLPVFPRSQLRSVHGWISGSTCRVCELASLHALST